MELGLWVRCGGCSPRMKNVFCSIKMFVLPVLFKSVCRVVVQWLWCFVICFTKAFLFRFFRLFSDFFWVMYLKGCFDGVVMRVGVLSGLAVVAAVLALPVVFLAVEEKQEYVVGGRVVDVRVVRGGQVVSVLTPLPVVVWGNFSFVRNQSVRFVGRLGLYKGNVEFIADGVV